MKKNILLLLSLSAIGTGIMSGCTGGNEEKSSISSSVEETNKFENYKKEDWLKEEFDGKSKSYQFIGDWEMGVASYAMDFSFLVNLYSDGSLRMEQMNIYSASSYYYYGYWNLTTTEDGKQIDWSTTCMTNVTPNNLVNAEYDYTFYEKSDGTYSSGIKFCLAPGQYVRDATVTGSSKIVYATDEAFHEAKKVVVTTAIFEGSNETTGAKLTITVKSDNTIQVVMKMDYNGAETAVYNATGTIQIVASEDGQAVTGYKLTITHEGDEDIIVNIPVENNTYGSFTVTISLMGTPVAFEMSLAENA